MNNRNKINQNSKPIEIPMQVELDSLSVEAKKSFASKKIIKSVDTDIKILKSHRFG